MPEEPKKPSDDAEAGPDLDNPLHKKLGIRPQASGLIVSPPQDDDNPLLPLPETFSTITGLDQLAAAAGPYDYIQVFARDKVELAAAFAQLRDKLAPGGSLWISWMKQPPRGGSLMRDLNENVVRRLALTHALVDVKIAVLDRDWSAMRLAHRKH
jgi:hypothetical protein